MTRLRVIWDSINASYWFYPALVALSALVLAFFTTWLDQSGWARWLITREPLHWLSSIKLIQPALPSSASTMLSLIAGSMLGMTATVFSITIAAVAFASGTYGPRLLTNFMEDRGNQLSLATFIGTFVYSLTVLRAVRSQEETSAFFDGDPGLPGFVPQLSLLVAYLFVGISVAVLVYFLHHIPASIRINSVLKGIGARLLKDIGERFPNRNTGKRAGLVPEGSPIVATQTGYIQTIDFADLEKIAQSERGKLKLAVRIGDFVHPAMTIAYWADMDIVEDCPDEEVRDCFALGSMRTPNQDTQFLIDELVEIALRALSPGVNDPFTAVTAVHWLGAATAELGSRDLTRVFAQDGEEPHLVLLEDDFEHYLARGFGSIRGGIATNRIVAQVTFDALVDSATMIDDESRRAAIRKEGELLVQQARHHLVGPELDAVEARYQQFLQRIER